MAAVPAINPSIGLLLTSPPIKNGVPISGQFILLSEELIDRLQDELDDTEKAELRGYIYRVTADEAGDLGVPVWSGEDRAIYLRVPANITLAKARKYLRRILAD